MDFQKEITNILTDLISKDSVKDIKLQDDNRLNILIDLSNEKLEAGKNLENLIKEKLSHLFAKEKINILFTAKKSNERVKHKLAGVKKIIGVASGKGGVGKSTIASNLSLQLASKNNKVGLVDADIHGPSIAHIFGVNKKPEVKDNMMTPIEKHGVKIMSMGFLVEENASLVWRGPMVSKALYQLMLQANWGELDYLIIDFPPGTGDVQLTLCGNYLIDGVILVSTPQEVALLDVKKAISMFEKMQIPIIGIIENMSYFEDKKGKKNHIFGKDSVKKLAKKLKIDYLTTLKIEPEISKIQDKGKLSQKFAKELLKDINIL